MALDLTMFGDGAAILRSEVPVRPADTRSVDEIRDDVRRQAALYAHEALDGLVTLARSSENERVVRDCWVAILDRGGVAPPGGLSLIGGGNKNVNILVSINQRRAALEASGDG